MVLRKPVSDHIRFFWGNVPYTYIADQNIFTRTYYFKCDRKPDWDISNFKT